MPPCKCTGISHLGFCEALACRVWSQPPLQPKALRAVEPKKCSSDSSGSREWHDTNQRSSQACA